MLIISQSVECGSGLAVVLVQNLSWGLLLLPQFRNTAVSDSFWLHGLQHTRPLCPSPSPRVCPSSCPLHQWYHPAVSSSDALFSFWEVGLLLLVNSFWETQTHGLEGDNGQWLLPSSLTDGPYTGPAFSCPSSPYETSLLLKKNSFNSGQLLSRVQLFVTPWSTARQVPLSIINSWSLPKLMPIESVMPSNYLISVVSFSSCPQSFPASGSFQMSQLLGGQSIGVSASTSVLPMNTQVAY